jgi:CBS domain-containing protein
MNRQSLYREAIAIFVSVFFLSLGVLAVWLSKEFLKLEGDAIFVSLLLVPIIVYMIFSGRLKELRAGGLEAKFVDIAGQSVELASETIEASVSDMEYVKKAGARELPRRMRDLDKSKPIILALTLGREGYYDRMVWLRYMEALSQFRSFKFVVILDQENRFVAYVPAWAILQILRMDALGDEFVRIINEGNIQKLRRYPGVVTRTISTKATNTDALREMTAQNLEALVVIDEDRKLKGVVEREQILSKLLLSMAR